MPFDHEDLQLEWVYLNTRIFSSSSPSIARNSEVNMFGTFCKTETLIITIPTPLKAKLVQQVKTILSVIIATMKV